MGKELCGECGKKEATKPGSVYPIHLDPLCDACYQIEHDKWTYGDWDGTEVAALIKEKENLEAQLAETQQALTEREAEAKDWLRKVGKLHEENREINIRLRQTHKERDEALKRETALEAENERHQWRKVEPGNLPEYDIPVLVVSAAWPKEICSAVLRYEDGWHWEEHIGMGHLTDQSCYEYDDDYQYTLWMPMPTAPPEGK